MTTIYTSNLVLFAKQERGEFKRSGNSIDNLSEVDQLKIDQLEKEFLNEGIRPNKAKKIVYSLLNAGRKLDSILTPNYKM